MFNNTVFYAALLLQGQSFALSGNTFHAEASFVKNGSLLSTAAGGNTFHASSSFTLNGTAHFQMAAISPDLYYQTVTLRNTSPGSGSSVAYLDMAYGAAGNTFDGDILLESTSGTFQGCGIRFGENGGTSILNNGFALKIGAAGFDMGRLILKNFTQKGHTAQQLLFNYAATSQFVTTGPSSSYSQLVLGPNTVFEGNVRFLASNPILHGCTFNGPSSTYIAKLQGGASSVVNAGGNVFNSPNDTLLNASTSLWTFAAVNPDLFNGNVVIEQTLFGLSLPVFKLAHGATTQFTGDLQFRYRTTSAAITGAVAFGNHNVIFNGTGPQVITRTINGSLVTAPFAAYEVMPRLVINKPAGDLTLHSSMNGFTISSLLSLISGRFVTASNAVPVLDLNSTATGASNSSHVSGPITKRGNTAFIFPVGKGGLYRPITISAPGTVVFYTAEYFNQSADHLYNLQTKETTLGEVNNYEYWTLSNTGVRDVMVTLSTGSNSNPVFEPHQLVVANWNGSQWTHAGNGAHTGTATNGTIRSLNALSNNFMPFTFAVPSEVFVVLKNENLEYRVRKEKKGVVNEWQIKEETGIECFEVQRSMKDLDFKTLTRIASNANGNVQRFQYTDVAPGAGTRFYRIKIVRQDGTVSFSNTQSIQISLNSEIQLYPNPAVKFIHLKGDLADIMAIRLVNTAGRSWPLNRDTANTLVQLPVVSSGIYYLQLFTYSAGIQTKRLMIHQE
jgi:hypothetical protein